MPDNISIKNILESANTIKPGLDKTDDNVSNKLKGKLSNAAAPKKNIENEYYEIDITDDISAPRSASVIQLSAVPDGIIPSLIGKIIDALDEDTKDGQIDATKQRSTGDCWLLSGINALSYTEEGRKIIKSCLEYEDGYTIVHLKGIGTYIVEDKELELVKSQIFGSKQYSKGDDDMLIFELAIEKALDDIASGQKALDPSAPWWLEGRDELSTTEEGGESSTSGGWGLELMYLVTGKTGNRYTSKEDMEKALLEFEKNGNKNMAMTASAHTEGTALDINGNEVKIAAPHAFAIKEVKNGIVTLTNPWDSSVEIQFTMETFLETFSGVESLDLSENNSEKSLVSSEYKLDSEGNKRFIFHDNGRDDYENTREVKYSPDGKPAEITTIRNGIKVSKEIYDPETGDLSKKIMYGKQCNVQTDYDPETGEKTYTLRAFYKDKYTKQLKEHKLTLSKAQYDKIISCGILGCEQFSFEDIENLLKLPDSKWSEALKYLFENPYATYEDIQNHLARTSKDASAKDSTSIFKGN